MTRPYKKKKGIDEPHLHLPTAEDYIVVWTSNGENLHDYDFKLCKTEEDAEALIRDMLDKSDGTSEQFTIYPIGSPIKFDVISIPQPSTMKFSKIK
jgi:hypothetical protein